MPPKKDIAWSFENDCRLIDQVHHTTRMLWDIQDPKYMRSDLKIEAWLNIAARFGPTITDLDGEEAMSNKGQAMSNKGRDEHRSRKTREIVREDEPTNRLESFPVELVEIILGNLRPEDLLAAGASSPKLQSLIHCRLLWRNKIIRIRGSDISSQLRQLKIARRLGELHVGLEPLTKRAANGFRNYIAPIPSIDTLRVGVSLVGLQLAEHVLGKYAHSTSNVELDLRRGVREKPRCNLAIIASLSNLTSLRCLTIRIDNINDVVAVTNSAVGMRIVELDVSRLPVYYQTGNPGTEIGNMIKTLITNNSEHIHTLRLPQTSEPNIVDSVTVCKELRTLSCNLLVLQSIVELKKLRCLQVLSPEQGITGIELVDFVEMFENTSDAVDELEELHFLKYNEMDSDLPSHQSVCKIFTGALFCALIYVCAKVKVVMIQWELPALMDQWSWVNTMILNNHLRELRLGGNWINPRQLLTLVSFCTSLEILDVRRSSHPIDPTKHPQQKDFTTRGCRAMRTALDLSRRACPKITLLFDDHADNSYDWNFYANQRRDTHIRREGYDECTRVSTFEGFSPLQMDMYNSLFVHLMTLTEWVSFGRSWTPSLDNLEYWRRSTLDSFMCPVSILCDVLVRAPALGLVDFRNKKKLRPGKKGLFFMKSLSVGPTDVGAMRIHAPLVSHDTWILTARVLERVGPSLQRLELDFRGRPFRDWRPTLTALSETPNIKEFVLRGAFDDEKPVFDWLHGRLPSVRRLDLRDCLLPNKKHQVAFVQSFHRLLEEVRGNLFSLSLPHLPAHGAPEVMATVVTMTKLREIGVHVNQLLRLRSLKDLETLVIYSDFKFSKDQGLDQRLAWSFRHLRVELSNLRSLTLSADLFESQLVREAVHDMLPNLRRLHVISEDRHIRTCFEGPLCRNHTLWAECLPMPP